MQRGSWMVLWLVSSAVAQGQGFAVSVLGGQASVSGGGSQGLPPGPVLAPIQVQIGNSGSSQMARAAIQPQVGTASPVLELSSSSSTSGGCTSCFARAQMSLVLTVSSPAGGRQWLRVLWEGGGSVSQQVETGVARFTVTEQRPGGFTWTESRPSLPGYPLYLDVPLDLSAAATVRLDLSADAFSALVSCSTYPYFCPVGGGAGGRMTFALRATAPPPVEPFGAACLTHGSGVPAALLYDPFGIPGRDRIEALLVCNTIPRASVLLWLGVSRDWIGGVPLPFDLTFLGAPGCFVLQDMVLSVPATVGPGEVASVPLLRRSELAGLGPIYFQWMIPDWVNPLGLVWSNAATLRAP
jgi:hypothetical protein